MFNWIHSLFEAETKGRLGIDIGTSAIKLVEIISDDQKLSLETYGLASLGKESLSGVNSVQGEKKQTKDDEKGDSKNGKKIDGQDEAIFRAGLPPNSILGAFSDQEIGQIIKELLVRSQAKARKAYFSLPTFTTFFATIELPAMGDKEINAAVPFEAAKYVPIPLEEVFLDWSVIPAPRQTEEKQKPADREKEKGKEEKEEQKLETDKKQSESVNVLVVAILKEAVAKYTKIAQISNLEVKALEPESFSLARALVGESKDLFIVVDIGSFFTNITLIDQGFIRLVYNLKKNGHPEGGQLDDDALVGGINSILNSYKAKGHSAAIPKYILTGGRLQVLDVGRILRDRLDFEVVIGNPFENINYPKGLEPALKEMSPSLGVAAGLAMRE
ncbi:pilus assembly protein PilM [Candidatus Falkowbacteria bacterium]|nr:pilus assembly protein PilM [Candidatus Falkowbacteria bacterium]